MLKFKLGNLMRPCQKEAGGSWEAGSVPKLEDLSLDPKNSWRFIGEDI